MRNVAPIIIASSLVTSMTTAKEIAPGARVGEFTAEVVYTDDDDHRVGARWVHSNGLAIATLRIQSVPQVLLHVNTPPISDRGEPHTGEHLLLGKGRKGKMLSAEQEMSLVDSTAWTSQTDVVYAWNCGAGKETFFRSVEQYLDALLLPDYTDEEVRREVCHLGVNEDAESGELALDEKGTIYQEMSSTYEKRWIAWYELKRRTWGADHPHGMSSGGEPAAVRTMQPHHIHDFHRDHYHLSGNLGLIVALPDSIPEREFLARLDETVAKLDADEILRKRPKTVHQVPVARPQEDRSLRVVEYPNANESDVGYLLVSWPAAKMPALEQRVLAGLLLETLGSGDTATLYRRLMDSGSREVEVGASSMFGHLLETRIDLAPMFGFDGVPPANLSAERIEEIVGVVRAELDRVASLAAGSDELAAFNRKALTKLTEYDKGLRKELNSPPLFGHRGGGGFWLDHLRLVDRQPGERRSLTLRPTFDAIRGRLEKGENPWSSAIAAVGLDGEPYRTASRPTAAELERRRAAKQERLASQTAALTEDRAASDAQAALKQLAAEYQEATAAIEKHLAGLPQPRLVDDVPMTIDPSLRLEEMRIAGALGHRGVFDNMSFAEVSLSLRLEGVAPRHYPWLAILPDLLTSSGVAEGDETIAYDAARERRAREIFGFDAAYAMEPSRARHELRLTASGADRDEAVQAIAWIEKALLHPWLDARNLGRLRDLVREESRSVRVALGGAEERWVQGPAAAIRHQDDPLFLSASAHFTRLLHLARVEWWLAAAPTAEARERLESTLEALAGAAADDHEANQKHLDEALARLEASDDGGVLTPTLKRLRELAADGPAATAAADLRRLVAIARSDLQVDPEDALAELDELRKGLLSRGDTRFVLTGSRTTTEHLVPHLERLLATFAPHARPQRLPATRRWIDANLGDHASWEQAPVHYGLVHDRGTSGVHVHRVRTSGLGDLDEKTLIDQLASMVYSGAGPHSFFMKTWGAGLAYSNGIGVSAAGENLRYYAERCPDLVETMKFVTGLVDDLAAIDDPYLAEYAVARAVGGTRESDRYEARARAMADDIVDGETDARVRRYRSVLLGMRENPDLWPQIRARVAASTGRVLPGIGPASRASRAPRGTAFLVIAPEAMLQRWEDWVQDKEGEAEKVHRIYGRDFWLWPEAGDGDEGDADDA